ncbi:excisionase [Paenibacillus herberti]|uniref:Excisionase n=2 Tax=Paenibacillus herberti TaxID=1619309 RepID=A0A229P5C1_9BACL|nr:excisionase [Paenibacillus herberti]
MNDSPAPKINPAPQKPKNTNDKLPEVMNVEDVRKVLGISKNAAYSLVKSGEFHVVKIGKKILIPKDGFLEWHGSSR